MSQPITFEMIHIISRKKTAKYPKSSRIICIYANLLFMRTFLLILITNFIAFRKVRINFFILTHTVLLIHPHVQPIMASCQHQIVSQFPLRYGAAQVKEMHNTAYGKLVISSIPMYQLQSKKKFLPQNILGISLKTNG